HVGSLEAGIERINRFHWFMRVVETVGNRDGHKWFVVCGESEVIFSADTREAVDAFLYGMSLAYMGIPDDLYDDLVEKTRKEWLEDRQIMRKAIPDSVTRLIDAFARLPGVGPKTASRLAYFLLRAPDDVASTLAQAIIELKTKTRLCSICYNITE